MADFVSVDRFPYYRNISRKHLPLIHQGQSYSYETVCIHYYALETAKDRNLLFF